MSYEQDNNNRPFTCEKCDIGFAYREDYHRHMQLHEGQRTLAESLDPDKKSIPREYVKYGFRIKNIEVNGNGKA